MTITTEHSPPEGPLLQPGRIGRMTLPNMNAVRWSALVASAVVGTSMTLAAPVAATPGRGFDYTVVWEHKDVDGKDYIMRRIVMAPGASSGWHSHDGLQIGTVMEGGPLLNQRAEGCATVAEIAPGQGITELRGPGEVHIGRNIGTEPLVIMMLTINPTGAPLSVDEPDPGCGFA